MKLITQRDLIRDYIKYTNTQVRSLKASRDFAKLVNLDIETANLEEMVLFVNNASWTTQSCDECEKRVSMLIEIGEKPSYESRTANVCIECVTKAYNLMIAAAEKENPK